MNDFASVALLDSRLRFVGTTTVAVSRPVKPSHFFHRDNPSVVVDPKFVDLLVDDDDLWTGKIKLSKHIIARGSSDAQVERALPEAHVMEANTFCQVIIAKIQQSFGGVDCDLLGNDFATLCYVWDKKKQNIFVIDIRLAGRKNHRRWHLLSMGRYSNLWNVGFQVLSPN